jgi:hypothetical protein
MALLIDGFNLIYKFPDLEEQMYISRLFEARQGLLEKLKEYQKIKKGIIRVVFDGKKEPSKELKSETVGKIDVYYSLDYSADFLIKQFIKKDPNPGMTTVVTSDKDIIFYVKRFRAKTMTSEEFAAHYIRTLEEHYASPEPEKENNPELSEDDISFWKKIFGVKS